MSAKRILVIIIAAVFIAVAYHEFSLEGDFSSRPPSTELEYYGEESLTEEQKGWDPTPDALTGEAMWDKADQLGWPKKWDARHHATHFILGAPKGGTTYIERCYSSGALSGDPEHHPYPKASIRWPVKFDLETGEPLNKNQGFIGGWVWNRTGYRRWDPAKEWRVYITSGEDGTSPKYKKIFSSMPPVELDSHKWSLLDATPTYLMNPWAADSVHADHSHDLSKPRFLVAWREAMARSFSHFVMIIGKGNRHARPNAFINRLHLELAHWNKTEGCAALYRPEAVLAKADEDIAYLRDLLRRCFLPKSFLGHSLPVLGLRYWLSKFAPSQFTVVKTEALKNTDPFFLINILEKAFEYKRLPLPCETPQKYDKKEPIGAKGCSGPIAYQSALDQCRDTGMRAASYSRKAGELNIDKGTPVDKAPVHALFRQYRKAMRELIDRFQIRFVNVEQ